jgi:heavy metal sensor kinase
MSRLSIRWRLTLSFGAVLATVLVVFGISVFLLMRRDFQYRTDRGLRLQMIQVEDQVSRTKHRGLLQQRLVQQYARHPVHDLQLTWADGTLLMRGERIRDRGLPEPSRTPLPDTVALDDFSIPSGGDFRMISRMSTFAGMPLLIQIATSKDQNARQLGELVVILLLAGPVAVGCALLGGYLLARQALAPVDRMAAAADEITATQLDRRLDAPNPDDELGRLARTLNGMIARLQRSFEDARRFTADAAHELRTPLAILRNEAEVALRVPRDSEEYRNCLEDMLEEIDHLSRLSEALLFLFREDAGLDVQHRELTSLDQLVHELAEHLRVVAAERGQELSLEVASPCLVRGDAMQLRRLISNLVDNAIKFTPPGGKIQVRVECRQRQATVVVTDTGIGIAPEHLPRIFDRFYRADQARSRRTDGSGLGLSICRSIAESHRGHIVVESQPGQGTCVTLTLPGIPTEPAEVSELQGTTVAGA